LLTGFFIDILRINYEQERVSLGPKIGAEIGGFGRGFLRSKNLLTLQQKSLHFLKKNNKIKK